MASARILAIDFGEKRVGLALSVPELKIAKPFKTVNTEDLWQELDEIFRNYKIETVVVGLPLRTDGTDAKITPVVKKLAAEIGRRFNVSVKLWDERFSTKSAEGILRMIGKPHSVRKRSKQLARDKRVVDKIAAAIILEEYLSVVSLSDGYNI